MGISLSLLSKLGVPGISSLTTDQVYEKFFKNKEIDSFDKFHTSFIDFCKFLNDVMPGKHFRAPTKEEIKEFHDSWLTTDEDKKKESLINFVHEKVKEVKTDNNAVIVTGLVVPAGAVMVKNAADSIPQVKRFRLHLVPNFVFVPTITFLAIAGVRAVQVSKRSAS